MKFKMPNVEMPTIMEKSAKLSPHTLACQVCILLLIVASLHWFGVVFPYFLEGSKYLFDTSGLWKLLKVQVEFFHGDCNVMKVSSQSRLLSDTYAYAWNYRKTWLKTARATTTRLSTLIAQIIWKKVEGKKLLPVNWRTFSTSSNLPKDKIG